jgi:hypothetical protein
VTLRLRLCAAAILLAAMPAFAAPQPARADPAAIPFRQDSDELGPLVWRSFLVMAGLAVCAGAVLWILRRHGIAPRTAAAGSGVRILDTLRVGPRASLLVVQFGTRRILVGHSECGMRVLALERTPSEDRE